MARLWSSGFELNTTTALKEWDSIAGSASVVTSPVRSGDYAGRLTDGSGSGTKWEKRIAEGDLTINVVYFRAYVRFADFGGTDQNKIMELVKWTGTDGLYIKVNSTGTLEFWQKSGATETQIGSDSSVLNLNQWYRIEIFADNSNQDYTARIDGTNFASTTTGLSNTGDYKFIRLGTMSGNGSGDYCDVYFDDIAVNDNTGSFQNSWPGEGKIVHMHPNAEGDNSGWTPSTGTDNSALVDEVTPNDATDYVSSTSDVIDDYELESSSNAGITNVDSITLVTVGVRWWVQHIDRVDIWARIKASSGGTVEEGTTSRHNPGEQWNTYASGSTVNPAYRHWLTLYDLPGASTTAWTTGALDSAQIGVRMDSGIVNEEARVSAVWLLVEYVPSSGPTIKDIADTASGSDSVSILNSIPVNETGSGSDQTSLLGVVELDDSAVTSDTISILAQLSLIDSTVGSDALSILALLSLADTATANEALSAVIDIALSDTSTSSDAISLLIQIAQVDSATGSEIVSLLADLVLSDAGSASDALNVLVTLATLSDTAVGADSASVLTSVILNDTGLADEALSLLVEVALSDTANATEALTLLVELALSEVASGSDSVQVFSSLAEISVADSGAGSEVVSILNQITLSDSGNTTEALQLLASLAVSDSATSEDAVVVLGSVLLADTGTLSTEALSLLINVALSESAIAQETTNLLAQIAVSDSGVATETLTAGSTANLFTRDSGLFDSNSSLFTRANDLADSRG